MMKIIISDIILGVMALFVMTISSCKSQQPTYPPLVSKVAMVSADSVYSDQIQVPFDSKGANLTVKMAFDESSNILTLTIVGNRNVFVFYDDTYYKKVFHKKFLGHRKMNPYKLSYPVLIQPGTIVFLSKETKASFPVPKGRHLFNNWLQDYSSEFTLLDPIKTKDGYKRTTLITDSIVQRFAVNPRAKEGTITLRNLLIIDKYSEKPLSKKEAAAFGALLPKSAKKAVAKAQDKVGAVKDKAKKAAGEAASKAPKQVAGAAQEKAAAAAANVKPNAAMIKTSKPIKWIISNDKDLNTTYYVKLQRNPCFGLEDKRDSSLQRLYDVKKAYRALIATCPNGIAKTAQERQIFRERRNFLRSRYLETTEKSECPDIQANLRDYNVFVDSIRNAPCIYIPGIDENGGSSIILSTGVSAQSLLDAARRIDNSVAQYTVTSDAAQMHDIIKAAVEIIRLMNRNIKEKGIINADQQAALEEYKKAEEYFKKIVLKQ